MAQNDAVRKMAGAFSTTPILAMHHMLRILPINLTLAKHARSFSDRRARLPPPSIPITILLHNTVPHFPFFDRIPTTLSTLPLPLGPQPEFTAPNPPRSEE